MIKVLFYEVPSQDIGGSKVSLFNMVCGFDSTVHPIIFAHFPKLYQEQLRKRGVEIIAPPFHDWPPWPKIAKFGRIGISTAWWSANAFLIFKLMRIIQEEKIQIVHCNNEVNANAPAIVASYLSGIPCVCHLRGFEPPFSETRPLFKKVSKFIAVSHFVKQCYLKLGLINEKNCSVVYNGIDINQFENCDKTAIRRRLGIDNNSFLIGMVGRPIEYKGHIHFVKIAAHVKKVMSRTHFVIFGRIPQEGEQGYSYYAKIVSLAKKLNVYDNLTFYEHVGNVADMMASLDIITLCSLVDNFGRVLFEALAAKVPIITFDAGGIREIIRNEVNGVIIPPGRCEQMASAVIKVLTNKTLQKCLITNGRQTALKYFDREVNAKKIINIYNSII